MEDAHADGAYAELYARRRAEALARIEADRAKGGALAAKADRREKALDGDKNRRKRKKEDKEAVAREETELKEWILMLRERLGNGATKIVLCVFVGDKYGGLLETKDYKADVAELAKLEAKRGKTPEDEKAFTRKKNAMAKKRSRAFQRVAAEKAEGRVEALADLVEKLEALAVLAETLSAEECYLVDLVSVI